MHAPKFWFNTYGWRAKALYGPSLIWDYATRKRLTRPAYRPNIPVICVGNINMGGVGKTPTVIHLLGHIHAKRPVILMRGYGGKIKAPTHITSQHTASDVGDEAKLASLFGDVIIAQDRAAGARLAQDLGADLIIMDDGLQNPDIVKDISILVLDSDIGFGNGCIFPAGPLREHPETVMPRIDLVLSIDLEKNQPKSRRPLRQSLSSRESLRPFRWE